MAKLGKKLQEAQKLVDSTKKYSVEEAADLVKKVSITKFDATVTVTFRLNLDPRKAEQNLRGSIALPNGSGKTRKVLALSKQDAKLNEAKEAGADFYGNQEYFDQIKGGWFDFDIIVATPDMMGELGKLGKILGPKGLMPNAKTGTVTMDLGKAVTEIKNGKVEYRVDKEGNIAIIVGKTSFDAVKLAENIKACYSVMAKAKPNTVKGTYVKNVSLAPTMGPGIKLVTDLQ